VAVDEVKENVPVIPRSKTGENKTAVPTKVHIVRYLFGMLGEDK
jgi:hypothetical protein